MQGLIVVGGTNDNGIMSMRSQLVALTPYADPGGDCSLPDFPVALEGAVGANINGVPTVCGGRARDARYTGLIPYSVVVQSNHIILLRGTVDCFELDKKNKVWDKSETLLVKGRGYAAAVQGVDINNATRQWLIMGGDDDQEVSKV